MCIYLGGFYHKDIHGVEYEEDTEQTVGTTSDYGLQLNILRTDPFDAVLYQTERLITLLFMSIFVYYYYNYYY